MRKSRVFTDIAGATVIATARILPDLRQKDPEYPAVHFIIVREQDFFDIYWAIPFASLADAFAALRNLEQPLLEQIVADAIELDAEYPF